MDGQQPLPLIKTRIVKKGVDPEELIASRLKTAKVKSAQSRGTLKAQKRKGLASPSISSAPLPQAPPPPPAPAAGDAFWSEIAGEVVGADQAEVIEVLKKLAFFDSIHDFWPERKTVKGISDEDEDEPEDLDEDRIGAVHIALANTIARYLGIPDEVTDASAAVSTLLQSQTGDVVSSTSGVEDKVLAYFKKKYHPFNEEEKYITIEEILDNWGFESGTTDWTAYSAGVGALPNALDIVFNGRTIKSLTDEERGTIAFFLMAYMNPQVQPGTQIEYFTFDMAPRDIGKIFARIQEVKNAIFPQNIADSASTSFSALLGRNAFFMGGNTTDAAPLNYPIRSNAFTQGNYRLQYVNEGFGVDRKFGFKIEIWNAAATEKLGEIPFGPGNEQGPSVNYLMDIISKLRAATTNDEMRDALMATEPRIGTVAKLTSLGLPDVNLLFDIKRKGDWEQMLLNGVTAVTGDRFAAAFRRLLRKTGIYHSSRGIKVWRGTSGLTPEDLVNRTRNFRIRQVVSKLALIHNARVNANQVRDDLQRMKAQADAGAERGYVFSEPTDFPTPLTAEHVAANYTNIASTFATLVLRARMKDLSAHIQSLIQRLDAFGTDEQTNAATCAVAPPEGCPEPPPPQPTPEGIDAALDVLEARIRGIAELEALNISFSAMSDTEEPIFVPLFEESGKLIKGATSLKFNFSAGPFVHPETGLSAVVARLLVLSKARRPEAVAGQINKLLVQYFQARDSIKEAFFDPSAKASIESLTDIQSGLSPAQVVAIGNAGGLFGAIERLAAEFRTPPPVPPAPLPPDSDGDVPMTAGAQVGGNGSPLQFRDLHDLFLELCLDATTANEIGGTPGDATTILDDIQSRWIMGVEEIRETAADDYGQSFEETTTTELISYLLSFRSGGDPLFDLVEGLSSRNQPLFNTVTDHLTRRENAPVEVYILNVLESVGAQITPNINQYASRAGWVNLPSVIQSVIINPAPSREVRGLTQGGGLQSSGEFPSNAANGSSSGVFPGGKRRGLYERLR